MKKYSAHWHEDCQRWWGKLLTGPDGHWCYDWDELPIDATCVEYQCCTCGKSLWGKVVGFFYGIYYNRTVRRKHKDSAELILRDMLADTERQFEEEQQKRPPSSTTHERQ